ncbi:MAG: signal peptidase I [Clostridia bacterium]|nr:signal peptidase I [Clostridia bacterium]
MSRLENGYDWMSSVITALVVVAILFAFVCRVVSVDGASMTNTLQHGDRLLITSFYNTPAYGDVVVINRVGDAPLIKRVIGLPGDRISIAEGEGVVYRNGKPLDEPYTRDGFTPTNGMRDEITVPEGQLFVLGDNRGDSLDSRLIGTISMDNVVGKALVRLMPNFCKITNGE